MRTPEGFLVTKISSIIEELQTILEAHGDIQVTSNKYVPLLDISVRTTETWISASECRKGKEVVIHI